MKRVKIFLTALTVLTVVGGALAFKALQPFEYAQTCNTENNICELDLTFTTLTTERDTEIKPFEIVGKPCKQPGNRCETKLTITQ